MVIRGPPWLHRGCTVGNGHLWKALSYVEWGGMGTGELRWGWGGGVTCSQVVWPQAPKPNNYNTESMEQLHTIPQHGSRNDSLSIRSVSTRFQQLLPLLLPCQPLLILLTAVVVVEKCQQDFKHCDCKCCQCNLCLPAGQHCEIFSCSDNWNSKS